MHYFLRFMLLATGFCLFTYGLLSWQAERFALGGILPFTDGFHWQGLHFLTLGLAMIPPSLFEIYQLELRAQRHSSTPGTNNTPRPGNT